MKSNYWKFLIKSNSPFRTSTRVVVAPFEYFIERKTSTLLRKITTHCVMKYNIVDCNFLPCVSGLLIHSLRDWCKRKWKLFFASSHSKFPYLSSSLHPALLTSFGRAHVSHSNSRRFKMCALFVLAHFHSWKKFHSRSTFPQSSVCLTTLPDSSDIETRSHSAASHRPGPKRKQQLISLGSICVWNKERKKGTEKEGKKTALKCVSIFMNET